MNWFAYLTLAKELVAEYEEGLSHHDIEARQRSAISRAYYAIFCTARDTFDPEHSYYPPQNAVGSYHTRLWRRLKNDPDRPECRYIGEYGSRLGESRRQADYNGYIANLSWVVDDAIANAEDLKEALEALPPCRA